MFYSIKLFIDQPLLLSKMVAMVRYNNSKGACQTIVTDSKQNDSYVS